jgi:ATP-binding cassette, subfamily B, bacterial PglK
MKLHLQYLREILYILGEDRKKLPWLIVLFLISSMLDLAGIGLIGPYLTVVMDPEMLIQGPIGQFMEKVRFPLVIKDVLIIVGLMLVGIFMVKAITAIFINRAILRFGWNHQTTLRTGLMQTYLQMPYVDYTRRNSSEYIQTIHLLAGQFRSSVLSSLLRILSEGIVAVVILALLAWVNGPVLAILVSFIGGMIFIYDRVFRRNLKLYGERASEGSRKVVQGIREGIMGLKEIRILGETSYFKQMVKKGSEEISENLVKTSIISSAPRYLLEFILITFVVLFVIKFLALGSDSQSLLPTLGIFGMASLRLMPLASLLTNSITQIRFGRHATSRLYADLKQREHQEPRGQTHRSSQIKDDLFHSLHLHNVNFRYPNTKRWALEDINLSIKAGESIGLIGPSGAGKTSLLDILLGLLEPQSGEIYYNKRNLKDTLIEWRSQVAYLPQEIFLIDNTLRHNVALGVDDSEIDETRLIEALRMARLKEYVEELPKGIDTFLGENGVRLSGGQRQRVALARAFYHERNVLVMDEATSSLDYETEREIVKEIKLLKGKKTIIVIAHRLSTLQHCDRIYQLDQGRIVEEVSYNQAVQNRNSKR